MPEAIDSNPLDALRHDRERARHAEDPNWSLGWLATVDADGVARVRTLVLREVGEALAVFTDASSPKWRELERSGRCEVATWFPSVRRQYRLQARPRPLARDVLEAHWRNRPEGGRVLDFLHARVLRQSEPVPGRRWLRERFDAEREALADGAWERRMPANVHAFVLDVERIERLTLDDELGLHDRRRWHPGPRGWEEQTLMP